MSATFLEAIDDMFEVVRAAWDTTVWPEENIMWPDMGNEIPATPDPWIRVRTVFGSGGQATLANHEGRRRFRRDGTIIIQLFTPSGEGLSRAWELGKVLVDALEGTATPRGVWFRNTRPNDIGPDGDWYQINVLADFEYDEVK